MKKIQFDNLNNWYLLSIQVFTIVCILLGAFDPIPFENPEVSKTLQKIGLFAQILIFSRSFWFQNYIQWNKKVMLIRIKSFRRQSFRFRDIENVELGQDVLQITTKVGGCYDFDLQHVRPNDAEKLARLIRENLG